MHTEQGGEVVTGVSDFADSIWYDCSRSAKFSGGVEQYHVFTIEKRVKMCLTLPSSCGLLAHGMQAVSL